MVFQVFDGIAGDQNGLRLQVLLIRNSDPKSISCQQEKSGNDESRIPDGRLRLITRQTESQPELLLLFGDRAQARESDDKARMSSPDRS